MERGDFHRVVSISGLGPNGDGWHSIELRISNGGGGDPVPPLQGTGWTTSYGFELPGIDRQRPSRSSPATIAAGQNVNGGDYAPVTDPGNGSVFRVGYATNLTNAIVLGSGRRQHRRDRGGNPR